LFLGPIASRRLHAPFPEVLLARGQDGKSVRLTPRERSILKLVAEGFPSKRIAYDLGISIKTVEKHRGKLMKKLAIHEVAGLTRYAMISTELPP
jgi:DNA-binding NarL/FixJ family response regulator